MSPLASPVALQHLGEDRHEHLHPAGGAFAVPLNRGLGEAHDRDVYHLTAITQLCALSAVRYRWWA